MIVVGYLPPFPQFDETIVATGVDHSYIGVFFPNQRPEFLGNRQSHVFFARRLAHTARVLATVPGVNHQHIDFVGNLPVGKRPTSAKREYDTHA